MKDAVSPAELKELLDESADIKVLDVRRREDRIDVEHPVPGAEWKDPEQIAEWSQSLGQDGEVIVYCVKGLSVCQGARDFLRERGLRSRIVEGGIRAWESFIKRS
jgi:rhodanese-related sulfurtransferase